MGSKTLKTQALVKKQSNSLVALNAAMASVTEGFAQMAALLSRDINPGALAAAYTIIDRDWKKTIEAQREAVRDALLNLAAQGTDSLTYNGKGYALKVSEPKAKNPDLAVLCAKAGLGQGDLGVAVVTYEVDPAKVAAAVAAGKLTEQDVEDARRSLGKRLSVEVK